MDWIVDRKTENTAKLLKLLAHPLRLRIILFLASYQLANVSEMVDKLDAGQSLVSQYLIKMKDKGILRSKREGKEIHYSIADSSLADAIQALVNSQTD